MKAQSMKTSISTLRIIAVIAIAFGVFFTLSACGQSDDAESSANEASVESQSPESAESDNGKLEQSVDSPTEDADEKAKEKAAEAADAAAKAKEEADRKAEEQKKKQEEEAKAHTTEELEQASLMQKTEQLEYSSKEAKPLTLVECSDPQIEVTSEGKIDLSELGSKTVAYTLSLDGQSLKREMNFKVIDTKSPKIDLVDKVPKIDVGADYDPVQNINFVKDPVDGELELVDSAPEAKGSKTGEEVFYNKGWYTVEGSVDSTVAGVYSIDVNAADIHGNAAHRTFDVTVVAPEQEAAQAADVHSYVLNQKTFKFHHPGCRSVKQMNDSNRQDVEMSRDEIIAMGYEPCGICTP